MTSETREIQPDPWATVKRETVWMQGVRSVWIRADEVDAARATVDARHAEEIAAKDAELTEERRMHGVSLASAAENAVARLEQLAAVQQGRDEKAAMHSELATLAGSAIVLATLDTLAGERPTQEPEHALPAAVWRLVQERDEARAANTANLREIVGMAGRFRQTLQTVRACIVALTPGHRTGYDWNADPLYLTRKEGEALSAIDAALSSPSAQEPQTVCEWRKHERYAVYYACSGLECDVLTASDYRFCPFCGKPLKLSPESEKEPRS